MLRKVTAGRKSSCERCSVRNSDSSASGKSSAVSSKPQSSSGPKGAPINQPHRCKNKNKSPSAGIIPDYPTKPVAKPKKTTKSDLGFDKAVVSIFKRGNLDFCRKCGDSNAGKDNNGSRESVASYLPNSGAEKARQMRTETIKKQARPSSNTSARLQVQTKSSKPTKTIFKSNQAKAKQSPFKLKQNPSTIQQYYKNENFRDVSDSAHDIDEAEQRNEATIKINLLDTIKELPETQSPVEENISSEDATSFKILSEPSDFPGSTQSETAGDLDPLNTDTLRKIKEFRDKNYFECHSSHTRILNKGNVTSLCEHKCQYRFYLNDRLFPEPLYTDARMKIRCVDCHLPLEFDDPTKSAKSKETASKEHVNGTIQAKVKLGSGDQVQDMIVMLPVKNALIITEKRKEPKKVEDEVMYFGVIKLGPDASSLFKQNLPSDSLALKYQKGYREFDDDNEEELMYEKMDKADVIVI